MKDAPRIDDEDMPCTDEEVTEFIDKHITCALPDSEEHPDFFSLIKKVQTHHHTQTCKKKKGKTCRFDAPWPASERTVISRGNTDSESRIHAKAILQKVYSVLEVMTEEELGKHTLSDILTMADVTSEEYEESLKLCRTKSTITYMRKLNERFISPYNTVISASLKSNMNIQFVTGIYAVLAYLTSYLCKPEHAMGELMKKAVKEANESGVADKLRVMGNVFIKMREISLHESILGLSSSPFRRSNVDVIFIPTGPKERRTRVMKSKAVLENMDEEDPNIFVASLLDKYSNRPDSLTDKCLAYFATNYRHKSVTDADIKTESTIEGFMKPVAGYIEKPINKKVIQLKNDMGEMRQRSRECVARSHRVSKEECPEEYYMRLLQLYWPWRDEAELKHADNTYVSKFFEVKDKIDSLIKQYEPYDEITPEDLENAYALSSDEEDSMSDQDSDDDIDFFNADAVDDVDDQVAGSGSDYTVRSDHMDNDTFYQYCC